MSPEEQARLKIDDKLTQAGWVIQDMKQLNLGAAMGVAVREYRTDTGPADYVLFVNRNAVGVIEAKKDSAGENLTVVESQTERYATASLKWRKDNTPLRFLFEATSQIVRFTDNSDPAPRSREIFHFFKPETLATWLAQPGTLRRRLAEQMLALILGLPQKLPVLLRVQTPDAPPSEKPARKPYHLALVIDLRPWPPLQRGPDGRHGEARTGQPLLRRHRRRPVRALRRRVRSDLQR